MGANLRLVDHPLARHKLTLLRDRRTEPMRFRALLHELAAMLVYEATRDLPVRPAAVQTPLAPAAGALLRDRVGLVPILRAGIGMVEGALYVLPQAQVWHLGLKRDESSLRPLEYYRRFPERPTVDVCLILDPMLATGGSAVAAVEILKDWGVRRIRFVGVLAAPEGVQRLAEAHPDVPLCLCAVDERLTGEGDAVPAGFIWPGLGDAGDRQFDTLDG